MRVQRSLAAGIAAAALVIATPMLASAAPGSPGDPPPEPQVWSSGPGVPFGLATDGPRVLVADGMAGTVGQLQPDGSVVNIVENIPGVTSVAVRGAWLAYTSTVTVPSDTNPEGENIEGGLNIRTPRGDTVYADIHAYEVANNVDQVNTYGLTDPDSCLGFTNTGAVDAHPYTVVSYQGDWLVADAGANAIFRVTDKGDISTVAVLPPQPITVEPWMPSMLEADDCIAGETMMVEPVPTGLVAGSGNTVYVATLPGFPGMINAQGAVWQLNVKTGELVSVATDLAGPTSLAIGKKGALYVAEYLRSGVSVIQNGTVSSVAELPGTIAVATAPNGTLWASTMDETTGQAQIVSISNGKVKIQGKVVH